MITKEIVDPPLLLREQPLAERHGRLVGESAEHHVGHAVELFAGGRPTGPSPARRYDVSADGQRFLMSTSLLGSGEMGAGADRAPKVIVVQNWVEELRQRVPVE